MQRFSRMTRTLALSGALTGTLLSAVSVDAQTLPIVSTTAPIVGGIIVPFPPTIVSIPGGGLHGGLWQTSGRADVDVDIDRSRERGQVVVR